MKTETHEQLRKELWIKAWVGTACAVTCTNPEAATKWADKALADFDDRFPKPIKHYNQEPPFIDTTIQSIY